MLPLLIALLAAAPAPPAPSPPSASALENDPQGWLDIMPGADLAGWTRVEPISTRGVKAFVDAKAKLWVPQGKGSARVLDCPAHLPAAPQASEAKPKVEAGSHEMLRHDKEVGDFIFHVEWRFTDPSKSGWNAGVYARVQGQSIWHQAQVGGKNSGYWFGDSPDQQGKIVRHQFQSSEQRVKPAGQWNVYEITGRGDQMSLWINGAVVAVWSGLKIKRGHVGLEAERHHIQFRNIRLKVLD